MRQTVSAAAGQAHRTFVLPVRAGLGDCAPSGRLRLDAVARWLQDVAYADVEDAGLERHALWVVRRTQLEVRRFPRFAERAAGTTFCSAMGRMWAERRTTITLDGETEPSIHALALWVHLDPQTGRPMPFSPEEISRYAAPTDVRLSARLRHPRPPEGAAARPWRFRQTDLDIAGHVNNAAYWQCVEEELLLAKAEPAALTVEMEYRGPAQPGEMRLVAEGQHRWILSAEGELHASVRFGEPDA